MILVSYTPGDLDIETCAGMVALFGLLALWGHYKERKETRVKEEIDRRTEECRQRFNEECRERFRQAMRDSVGGMSKPADWDERRCYVLERDGDKCVRCGATESLHVHHIDPKVVSQNHSVDNLIALCEPCHIAEGKRQPAGRVTDRERQVLLRLSLFAEHVCIKNRRCCECETRLGRGELAYVRKTGSDDELLHCETCIVAVPLPEPEQSNVTERRRRRDEERRKRREEALSPAERRHAALRSFCQQEAREIAHGEAWELHQSWIAAGGTAQAEATIEELEAKQEWLRNGARCPVAAKYRKRLREIKGT